MKIQWKKLLICIAIPILTGLAASFLTRENMSLFDSVRKPPLAPPAWLFPVAWTILYVLMGIASYLVLLSCKPDCTSLIIYGVQLAFNFAWSLFFFNLKLYLFSFLWLILLWLLILTTILLFRKTSKTAVYLMIPYLVWVTFAGYLNFGIFLLNG